MRAAFYHGPERQIGVERVADPMPGSDELLVQVAYCGICGSDVSMTSGGPFDYRPGTCFGHEFAGTIVDFGAEVSGFKRGERIACMPMGGCGHCESCRAGRLLLCMNGRPSTGGFAEYSVIAPSAALRLPQTLSLADGALIEPMACGLRALKQAGLQPGDDVLVLGAGSMALSVIWWARRLGAGSITVASRSAHRRALCLQLGADDVQGFDDAALNAPPHIVAECVGKPGMLNLGLARLRPGGTLISMGMCQQPEPVLPAGLTYKEVRIIFPLGYSVQEFERTAREFDAAHFHPEMLLSDILPLDALPAAIAGLREGAAKKLKIHIDPRLEN
jgi:(R,R)-butanediol dehydrogenase/meso-butanediol dehydrogenase/diacetyl reductase